MSRLTFGWGAILFAGLTGLLGTPATHATWSILIADWDTGEIAIGSATCVEGINLQRDTPVLIVGVGAATAQSFVDTTGANRELIWAELQAGTSPLNILRALREREGRQAHNTRQYGIVDTQRRAATFSGNRNGDFAGGRTGEIGTLVYAVQGNVITGMPVVDAAADAIENTSGDLPEKLMAAMEAAYCQGGDGRCSCDEPQADDCGAPPDGFSCDGDLSQNPKTAHVGYIIGARRGDIDGACDSAVGCASGSYFLTKNVRGTNALDPDPVITLRSRFNNWRNFRRGEPDQVQSIVDVSPNRLPPGAAATVLVRVELRDWEGLPPVGVESVEVMQDPAGSANSSTVGSTVLVDGDLQIYEAEVTSGDGLGLDTLAVKVTYDGGIERYLMPGGRLAIQDPRGDFNGDQKVDAADLSIVVANFGGTQADGDFDGNGSTDLTDLALLLTVPGLAWE